LTNPNWDYEEVMGSQGYPEEFQAGACRYDSGGAPNPVLFPMIANSLNLVVRELTQPKVEQYCKDLSRLIVSNAKALGLSVWANSKAGSPHIIGISWETPAPSIMEVYEFLRLHKIYVSVRVCHLRVSVHIYNTVQDVQEFNRKLQHFFATVHPKL